MPKAESTDKGLSLVIYVGDMATPRAVVRVADMIRQRGVRQLNILLDGEVKVVLMGPIGALVAVKPVNDVSIGTI